jgi:type IV fimbrial biogenesis protein FimT
MSQHPTPARQRQTGFTLIESMVVLAVVSVTAGIAVPSFQKASERRQLEGAAAQLATDIRHARSSAVALSSSVRVSFQQVAGGSCYLLHTGRAADCQCDSAGAAICSNGAQVVKAVGFSANSDLQISSNSASMLFDHSRGTVTPTASINVQFRNGPAIRQVVNIMGRARACTPSTNLPGYPAC